MDEKFQPANQTTITAGNNNVITSGDNNVISVSYSFIRGNVQKLQEELTKNDVSQADIDEISHIVQTEKPEAPGQIPEKAQSWMKKMVQKSLDGVWKVGVSTAGHLLAGILTGFYGPHK